ncbi:DNA cytosine methyltransferase [Tumebacillus flagellatus]|uniref:Cytosine-specific methyltransferase n=1 Tax=Tumebacillus flagellatus TaxID=1157490 RepID=A0A074LMN6_9BACL|nr:DNA cytosine methyltransferase [Tumebacillus flagellatus]KEO81785.1 hypothetical protein EL26_18245 [Tumebacillus flagellatus]
MEGNSKKKPVAIDLFSGVGGMTLGFEMAGFDVRLAVEHDDIAAEAHRLNFPHCDVMENDIKEISGNDILNRLGLNVGDVDVIIGGPPCQGFSNAGQRAIDDPRNELLLEYARIVLQVQPKYFVMENVRGLMSFNNGDTLRSFIEELQVEYQITEPLRVLKASKFGVPQNRKRLFVLGVRRDLNQMLPYPEESHIDPDDLRFEYNHQSESHSSIEKKDGKEYCPTVADAISDLPNVDEFEELIAGDTLPISNYSNMCSKFALIMRREITDSTDFSTVRPTWDHNIITNLKRTMHDERIVKEFASLLEGQNHRSRRKKLLSRGLSPTIRAGTKSDKGSYTALRPIHYKFPRVITVREAARLMSFPDWMIFHETKWHGFRLVGNAVPPLLAKAVANEIIELLKRG